MEPTPQAKPGTILVNGAEAPEPMREAPTHGTWYWFPDLGWPKCCAKSCWYSHPVDIERLQRGICHLTESAARAHFEALIAPSRADAQPNSVEIDGIKEPEWIEWKGGECPVLANVNCQFKRRDGRIIRSYHVGLASGWKHKDNSNDIIAYRVCPAETKQAEQEQQTKSTRLYSYKELERAVNMIGLDGRANLADSVIAEALWDTMEGHCTSLPRPITTELSSTAPDRQQQRFELAKAVLTGLIAHHGAHHNQLDDSRLAIEYADRALAELERTK